MEEHHSYQIARDRLGRALISLSPTSAHRRASTQAIRADAGRSTARPSRGGKGTPLCQFWKTTRTRSSTCRGTRVRLTRRAVSELVLAELARPRCRMQRERGEEDRGEGEAQRVLVEDQASAHHAAPATGRGPDTSRANPDVHQLDRPRAPRLRRAPLIKGRPSTTYAAIWRNPLSQFSNVASPKWLDWR